MWAALSYSHSAVNPPPHFSLSSVSIPAVHSSALSVTQSQSPGITPLAPWGVAMCPCLILSEESREDVSQLSSCHGLYDFCHTTVPVDVGPQGARAQPGPIPFLEAPSPQVGVVVPTLHLGDLCVPWAPGLRAGRYQDGLRSRPHKQRAHEARWVLAK